MAVGALTVGPATRELGPLKLGWRRDVGAEKGPLSALHRRNGRPEPRLRVGAAGVCAEEQAAAARWRHVGDGRASGRERAWPPRDHPPRPAPCKRVLPCPPSAPACSPSMAAGRGTGWCNQPGLLRTAAGHASRRRQISRHGAGLLGVIVANVYWLSPTAMLVNSSSLFHAKDEEQAGADRPVRVLFSSGVA